MSSYSILESEMWVNILVNVEKGNDVTQSDVLKLMNYGVKIALKT